MEGDFTVKLFSYYTKANKIQMGIELDNRQYNFSQLWEFYKDIKGLHQAPQVLFAQIMIELGFFNYQDIHEVIATVRDLREIDDLRLPQPIRFDVPVSRPQKIICIGRNYVKHAQEFGNIVPEEPIFFAKVPSAMIPHEGSIILPSNVGRVDHEIELAVVIGRQGKNIDEALAYEYVAGYTIVNDVTARALQKADIEKRWPWHRSKNFDTFCPVGPYLVPSAAIPDPHNLNMTLKVNGEIRQQSNTSLMIHRIPKLISYLSTYMTLQPGDIIATGTPDGVSQLKPDDIVEGEIEHLGLLRSDVRAARK